MIYPTKEEFLEYSGESIGSKLSGDVKEQDKLWEILMKRCYRIITTKIKGIIVDPLTEEQQTAWKEMLMEQAEYLLSVGDKALIDGSNNLSGEILDMAVQAELWGASLC